MKIRDHGIVSELGDKPDWVFDFWLTVLGVVAACLIAVFCG